MLDKSNFIWYHSNRKKVSFGIRFFENGYKNWYCFGIILVWKLFWNLKFAEKTKENSRFRRKILLKTPKNVRKLPILIGFWEFFKTPKTIFVQSADALLINCRRLIYSDIKHRVEYNLVTYLRYVISIYSYNKFQLFA